ncbi:DUF4365 domain-containing protein [Kitasatospora sp. NPDC050543]|uniref:DUF4365 domain-containing protein n=1 Tax=Kitasatospora sp. NPDC050543 TaxID=3364054 RepID=UPI0037901601
MTIVRATHLVDRAGVNRAAYLVATQLGWLFREQDTSDVGIDAHLEVVTGASLTAKTTGGATGRLLAVQIKSGASQFASATEGGWWFRCDAAHVAYWQNHSLPVVVMLFDPETERVHWQHVNSSTLISTGKDFKVYVPSNQQIDTGSAFALSIPARPQTDPDPLQAATDQLPGDSRTRLLSDHRAGASHALPLAVLLAEAPDPGIAVIGLLTQPPAWLSGLEPEHERGAWKAIAAYAAAHELGLPVVDALERAAAADPEDNGRLLALAAIIAAVHAPDRAPDLAAAGERAGYVMLASIARALLDAEGGHLRDLPETVAQAIAAQDPSAVGDVNVLRFVAHCHFAAGRDNEGEEALEKALRIAPDEPNLQLECAQYLVRRNASGAPRQASFDAGRAQRLALAARADYRRWHGPSAFAAAVLMQARLLTDDVMAAIRTAIAEPEGEAQGPETTFQPLQLEAARLCHRAGQLDLAEALAQGLTDEGAKLQLDAFSTDADLSSSREARIAAWEAAAAGATDEDQLGAAAFALTGLGVWPVPHFDELLEQGIIPEAVYQTRWAVAEAEAGEVAAAIRRLRTWENISVVAATGLITMYERGGQLALAAEVAERAGIRFGDASLRVLAVDLWDRSGEAEQARIRALTLLSRPFLPTGMRRYLRGMAIQWANDRADWTDMEDHSLVGLAEEVGIEDITALASDPTALPEAALPFVWAAIRAQLNARNLESARDTLARFAPQIRNTDDARSWMMLVGWSGWTITFAETAIDLAERYYSDDAELAGALLGGLLTATGGPSEEGPQPGDAGLQQPLVLPEALERRLRDLLANPPANSRAFTMMPGTAEDLVRFVEQDLGPREWLIQAAADAVRVGSISMGTYAASRPVALTFSQRAAGLIPAASIDSAHIEAEVRAALGALNGTVVLDVSAIALTTLLPGRFDQLRSVFTATPTTTAVYDDVIRTRYALDGMLRSSGQLGVWDGRFTMSEYSDQDKEHLARQAIAFTEIIPTLQAMDVTDLALIRDLLGLPTSPDDADVPWLSAAQHALAIGSALWCDDVALRGLLIQAGIPTFGTVALLHVLKEHNGYPEFTAERHDLDIRTLLESYVVDLPLSSDDLIEAAAAGGDWKPGCAAIVFARPQLWASGAAEPLWATVVERLWDNAPDRLGDWYAFAVLGLTALKPPEDIPEAVAQLAAATLLAAGVGPEVADALWPALLRALDTCSHAANRRRSLTVQAPQTPPLPTESELRSLLRSVLLRQLTDSRGFSEATSAAFVDAALPELPEG